MKKLKVLLLILVAVIASGFAFQKQLATHLKIALFITEQFPQIPIKPLGLVSLPPFHEKVELASPNGKIVGDLFIPVAADKKPAVILAMGVKTSEKDKPLLWHFAQTMARLGYVTFWPRLEALDKGQSLPEEPETFIKAFKYLDKSRISFVGFSVGSSTAFVASTDPQIKDLVHGLVFFGGYFDVFDYLKNLATKSMIIDGQVVSWKPDEDAINHSTSLLQNKKADDVVKIFTTQNALEVQQRLATASAKERADLKNYSPKEKLADFRAKIFILHDKSDNFVPYVESIKLNQALKDNVGAFVITDLFEHVQPNRPIKLGELVKLYGFLYQVLNFL